MQREPGQSRESWAAFQEWWRLQDEASTARIHMRHLERELREARKAVKAAEAAEAAAMRDYEAVPFSEACDLPIHHVHGLAGAVYSDPSGAGCRHA